MAANPSPAASTQNASGQPRQLRVCYFGTYRAEYSRNRIMIAGLRCNGIEVIECHRPLWRGIQDRVDTASGGWRSLRFLGRLAAVYAGLLWDYTRAGDYDILVIGYPGQMDAFLARILSWLRGRPLVMDVFMSISLVARERGLQSRSPLTDRLLHRLERTALSLPDALIQDTQDYRAWLAAEYDLAEDRFHLVPTGADDRTFRPATPAHVDTQPDKFTVVYYGTFIPNHGVGHILQAARLLKDNQDIHFLLIGEGPEKARMQAYADIEKLSNVSFQGWQEAHQLVATVGRADICLGAFGTTPQSMMTIQNKIYEGLAMRKAVITGDSQAVRRALRHLEHVYLCDRQEPRSLSQAILALKADPALRAQLAEAGYRLFQRHYSVEKIGQRFAALLEGMAGEKPHDP